MRRWIAIALLGMFISTNTEVHQFLKMPALFQHWSSHQEEGAMGWVEFLAEHYFHDDAHEGAHHGDQDFPFQCDHHCMAQTLQARIEEPANTCQPIFVPEKLLLIPVDESVPDQLRLKDIWQPPRA